MAGPKKKYKRVSDAPSRTVLVPKGQARGGTWVLHTPDNKRHTFYSAKAAQRFVDKYYPNYSLEGAGGTPGGQGNTTPKETSQPAQPEAPKTQPHFASEDLPVYIPSEGSTPFERMMNAKIANNRQENLAYRRALDNLGMNPFKWPERGGLLAGGRNESYWDSDIHKAVREGNDLAAFISSAPFLAYGAAESAPFLWKGLKWGVNTLGRAMVPSQWASGLASYSRLAPYADKLATAGKWGDALLGSYYAGKGLPNVVQGLYNVEPSQVAQGVLDLITATPYGWALRSSRSLMPAVQWTPSSTPTNFLGKVDNFISSPRTATTGTALSFGGLTAAANNTPRYKPRLDENGNYIYGADGKPELERDEQGNPIMVYPGLFQGMSWDNAEDYLIPIIMAIEGVRGGYRQLSNKRPPGKYTVGTGENATVKYTRDLPERPTGERPTYQEALELPQEMVPKAPVQPTPEQFGVRPRQVVPEFNEPILPDPRNTLRVSNVENPRDVLRRRTAGGTPTVEDIEEFRRLQRERAAEGSALADDVAAYESQQGRIAEHNQRVTQADAEYNSPEQVRAREQYQQAQDAYNNASSNYQATYDEALRKYNQQQRNAFESTTGAEWDSRNSLWQEALASPEYKAWQESQYKALGIKDWLRNNKWNIGRFGTYGALWLGPKLYRSWRDYNRALDPRLYDGLTPRSATPTNPVDTIGIIPGVNVDSLRQAVRDSVINYSRYPNNAPELVEEEDEDNN